MADESKTGTPDAVDDVTKHMLRGEQAKGAFVRRPTKFHEVIRADGSTKWPAEKGRYHLIVSHACPWAHRCVLVRLLKGLEDVIGITYAGWDYASVGDAPQDYRGWKLDEPDPFFGTTTLGDFYEKACPGYYESYAPGRPPISTPVLFDTKTRAILNNESAEIIRMLNSEFNEWSKHPELDLNPEELRDTMQTVNDFVYPNINDGVYRNGFAKSQEAYDRAATNLWEAIDKCEAILSKQRYIAGNRLTLSDIRLFTTLARLDPVYYVHFKCCRNRLSDMPALSNYVKELYQLPGVANTFNWELIRVHYYRCHTSVNPNGIIPIGPKIDHLTPHDRATRFPDASTPGLVTPSDS